MSSLFSPYSAAPSLYAGLGAYLSPAPAPYAGPMKWIAVQARFEHFNKDVVLTPVQRRDGLTKRAGVVNCLNREYYGMPSETENSFLIGSWGKNTAMRPPRDVDLYFVLPPAVYHRFQANRGNRQSALLQEVKGALARTYPNTDMRGDGQVVMVGFDSFNVEVVPAFLLTNGRYWICNTHSGGSYTETDPWAERRYLDAVDTACNNNLRPLIRMLKAWQSWSAVPIKSFLLELVAAEFLSQSAWRQKNFFWFDWIARDFFAYLWNRANSFVTVPGAQERVWLGNHWQSRTESAWRRAVKACEYEERNQVAAAGEEWQKIFGTQIPRTV
jgi:hypothetical protein